MIFSTIHVFLHCEQCTTFEIRRKVGDFEPFTAWFLITRCQQMCPTILFNLLLSSVQFNARRLTKEFMATTFRKFLCGKPSMLLMVPKKVKSWAFQINLFFFFKKLRICMKVSKLTSKFSIGRRSKLFFCSIFGSSSTKSILIPSDFQSFLPSACNICAVAYVNAYSYPD